MIKQDSKLQRALPAQLSSDKEANAKLATLKDTMESGSNTIVIGTFVTNLLLSASLSFLWGMINTMQIIGNMPNFNLFIPANVDSFFTFIQKLQNFDFLPTDWFFDFFGITDEIQPVYLNSTSQNSTRLLLYKDDLVAQKNIFRSLGPLFMVLVFGFGCLAFLILLKLIGKMWQSIGQQKLFKKIYLGIQRKLFWNSTLCYIIESYMGLTLQSLTLLKNGFDFSTNLTRAQAIFTITTLIICSFSPITMTIYFSKRIELFMDKNFISRFGTIICEFNHKFKLSACFISIFCYRRLIEVMLIVFMGAYPYAQVQLMTLSCTFVLIFFGYSNTYRYKMNRRLEYLNEATILICCYHLFTFTEFVDEPEKRYQIGYSLIAFTALSISVNIFMMIVLTLMKIIKLIQQIRVIYRKCIYKRKLKKKIQQRVQKKLLAQEYREEILRNIIRDQQEQEALEKAKQENQEAEREQKAKEKRKAKREKLRQERKQRMLQQQLYIIEEVVSDQESESKQSGNNFGNPSTQRQHEGIDYTQVGEWQRRVQEDVAHKGELPLKSKSLIDTKAQEYAVVTKDKQKRLINKSKNEPVFGHKLTVLENELGQTYIFPPELMAIEKMIGQDLLVQIQNFDQEHPSYDIKTITLEDVPDPNSLTAPDQNL